MNNQLIQYGIADEESDLRVHVSVVSKRAYVYFTKAMQELVAQGNYQQRSAYQIVNGKKEVTATGYIVPIADSGCWSVAIPDSIFNAYLIQNYDSTTAKGDKALRIVQELLRRGLLSLPLQNSEVSDIDMQIKGADIIATVKYRIQVKCDYHAGEGGTGNLFVQTHERNPLKRY